MSQPRRRSDRILGFLNKYEPRIKKDEEPKALVLPAKAEILPPEKPSPPPSPPPLSIPEFKSGELSRVESILAEMMETQSCDEPNGPPADTPGGPNKTATVEASRLKRSMAELVGNLDDARRAIEGVRALNRVRHEQWLDIFVFRREALAAEHRLKHAFAAAQREELIDIAKARAATALFDREARDAESDLRPAPPQAQLPAPLDEEEMERLAARRAARNKARKKLDQLRVVASVEQEKVATAQNECIAIYQNLDQRAGERRTRISTVLDTYGFDWSILPLAIQEFMEEGATEDETI